MMRKSIALLGLTMVATATPLLAQATPATRDGTNDMRSQNLGVPGQSSNPADQLIQRQGLQNLSSEQRAQISQLGRARPAKKDELTAGATVNDNTGTAIAKIAEVDPDGIVLSLGAAKVKVPADAFGRNKSGLLLDMTKAQFEQLVAGTRSAS